VAVEVDTTDCTIAGDANNTEALTVGMLWHAITKLVNQGHGGTSVSLMVGPEYEDVPLTQAMFTAQHGTLFLMGESDGPDDDEELSEQEPEIDAVLYERDPPDEYIDVAESA
jgi:hypothetical protein